MPGTGGKREDCGGSDWASDSQKRWIHRNKSNQFTRGIRFVMVFIAFLRLICEAVFSRLSANLPHTDVFSPAAIGRLDLEIIRFHPQQPVFVF